MAYKRIIPCLDVKDSKVVKGINFEGLKSIADPVELAQKYYMDGADELVFLDISATLEARKTMLEMVEKVAKSIFIPFTVGGGISTVEDMRNVILKGADKVSINSSAVKNPKLITDGAKLFGSQCIVVAVDTKKINGREEVVINGGTIQTGIDALEWIKKAADLGAGEILLTSMDSDGTKSGYDTEFLDKVTKAVNIPVIASGGCGSKEDILEVFEKTGATGALAASIFHYNQDSIGSVKKYLSQNEISVRVG